MEKLIRTPAGFVVAFDITLAIVCGNDPMAGLYLSQHNYWSSTEADADGWICKTSVEWTQRTLITQDVQRRVRKKLSEMGFIEEKAMGIPRKRHSRLIVENIQDAVDAVWAHTPDKFWEIPKTSVGEIPNTYLGNSQALLKDKKDLREDLKPPSLYSPQGENGHTNGGNKGGKGKGKKDTPSIAFSEFWAVYPKKVAKPRAWAAWKRQGCEAIAEQITEAAKSHPSLSREPEFIPHPATWLNGRQWEDEAPKDLDGERKEQGRQEASARLERQRRQAAIDSICWLTGKTQGDVTEEEIAAEMERMGHHGGD